MGMTRTRHGRTRSWSFVGALILIAVTVLPVGIASADGNEQIGSPSIAIAEATGTVSNGVGLVDGPASLSITVPDGAAIVQVLLYWEGQHCAGTKADPADRCPISNPPATTGRGDDTLVVAGTEVTGVTIGGPNFFFQNNQIGQISSTTYRKDITSLGLISAGANSIAISGADFEFASHGAEIVVLYDDGVSIPAPVDIRDGNDLAFKPLPAPRNRMTPQTYTFDPHDEVRIATLHLIISSIGVNRPNILEVTTDGDTQTICDPFTNSNGQQWDDLTLDVTIPPGATTVVVEPRSETCPDSPFAQIAPASMAWSLASLFVPAPQPPVIGVTIDKTNDADGDATYTDDETAPAEGAPVPFHLVVTNTSEIAVDLTDLTDTFLGTTIDLLTGTVLAGTGTVLSNDCDTLDDTPMAVDEVRECDFTLGDYAPAATDTLTDTAAVTIADPQDPTNTASDDDDSLVRSEPPVDPSIGVTIDKTNDADGDATYTDDETAPAQGASVPFHLVVTNTSEIPVNVTDLSDTFDGITVDLLAGTVSDPAITLTANDCDTLDDTTMAVDEVRECDFTLDGYAPSVDDTTTDTAAVTVADPDDPTKTASDDDDSLVRTEPDEDAEITIVIDKVNDADGDGDFTDLETAPTERAAVPFELTITNPSDRPVIITDLTDTFADVRPDLPGGTSAEQTVDLLTGVVSDPAIRLLDNDCAALAGVTMAPDEVLVCTFTLDGYSPLSAVTRNNVAAVSVVDVEFPGLTANDDDDSNVTMQPLVLPGNVRIAIDKTNDADGDGDFTDNEEAPLEDADVTFRLVITNPSDQFPALLTTLTDEFDGITVDLFDETVSDASIALTGNECAALDQRVLDPLGSATCEFTLTGYAPAANTEKDNVATIVAVSPTDPGVSERDNDPSTVFVQTGGELTSIAVTLVKTNDADLDKTFTDLETSSAPGKDVTFLVTVTNPNITPFQVDSLEDTYPGVTVNLLTGTVTSGSATVVSNTCSAIDDTPFSGNEERTCQFTLGSYSPPRGQQLDDTVTVVVSEPGNPANTRNDSDPSSVKTALANTGMDVPGLTRTALSLIGLGAVLAVGARRRQEDILDPANWPQPMFLAKGSPYSGNPLLALDSLGPLATRSLVHAAERRRTSQRPDTWRPATGPAAHLHVITAGRRRRRQR